MLDKKPGMSNGIFENLYITIPLTLLLWGIIILSAIQLLGCGYSLQGSVSIIPDNVSNSQINQGTRPITVAETEATKEDLL